MLWSIDSCQNRVSTDQYNMGSGVQLIEVTFFLKFSADQLLVFSWSQANGFKSAIRLTFIWKSYNKILKGCEKFVILVNPLRFYNTLGGGTTSEITVVCL